MAHYVVTDTEKNREHWPTRIGRAYRLDEIPNTGEFATVRADVRIATLDEGIRANRLRTNRYRKAERVLRNVRRDVFRYDDEGRGEKATRVIRYCQRVLAPLWDTQARNAEARRLENYMM